MIIAIRYSKFTLCGLLGRIVQRKEKENGIKEFGGWKNTTEEDRKGCGRTVKMEWKNITNLISLNVSNRCSGKIVHAETGVKNWSLFHAPTRLFFSRRIKKS